MNKFIIPSFILLSSVSGFGQVLQLPLKIVAAPLNTWDVSWTSVDGRSYFFQVGDSLSLWHYASVIEFGDGGLVEWGFDATDISTWGFTSTSKFFVRLKYADIPTTDPDLADFDGDGIPNLAELNIGTDPFTINAFVDSDNDGLPDAWEIHYWGNNLTLHSGIQDTDGDGLTNKEELELGLDPTHAETNYTAARVNYTYDLTGRLTFVDPTDPTVSASTTFTPDDEGNILSAQ
jgi:Bacterial TSP3 repeat